MRSIFLLLAGSVTLAACDSTEAPTGQVAATVDGKEITVSQINGELNASGITPDQNNAELTNQVLDGIINRAILAEEARERGLDKTPAGSLALQRAEETALVELLRLDIQSQAPTLSDDEARQFISSNRAMFDDRFVSVVEQVVVPSIPAPVMAQLEDTETLDEVRAILDDRGLEYQTTMGSVDTLTIAPAIASQIVSLGVGEVYIIPQGDGARINAVVSRSDYPITGDDALKLAREMVQRQRANGQAEGVFRSILAEKKDSVRYADTYAAPATASPQAAPATGSANAGQ